jgi:hypothetical protein
MFIASSTRAKGSPESATKKWVKSIPVMTGKNIIVPGALHLLVMEKFIQPRINKHQSEHKTYHQ